MKDSVRAMAFAYASRMPTMTRILIGKRRDGLNIMLIEYGDGPLSEGMTNELFIEEGTQFVKMSSALLFDLTREQFYFLASRVRADLARVEEWCEELETLYERRNY